MRARWIVAAAASLLLAGATASSAAAEPAPAPGYSATGTWQLLALVNSHRRALHLPPLTVDPRLAGVARQWAEELASSGDLRHDDALFTSSSHRALGMRVLGENVGWNYGVPAQDAAFLASPGHRANIELPAFRAAGFAVVRGGDGRIWSTEDFGAPAA
jgi:uncharacterized protein YkwD